MPVISAAAGHSSLQSMTPYARFSEDAVTDALDAGEEEMQKQMAKAGETKRQMDEAEKERKLLRPDGRFSLTNRRSAFIQEYENTSRVNLNARIA